MNIVKLDATHSTNTYLKELQKTISLQDGTIVHAERQTRGRGQTGASWFSERGKSLTFSILKNFEGVNAQAQYGINLVVSLGVMKALSGLGLSGLAVKWPNDIMSDGRKICGILIEPQLRGGQIYQAILGIGLNVNNQSFDSALYATSMKLATGRNFSIPEVLETVAAQVLEELSGFSEANLYSWRKAYETELFKRDQVMVFQLPEGSRFNGIIRGISSLGLLQVELESGAIQTFGLKEIKMLF